MNKTEKAFRLIVIRRPYQRNLFTEEEPGKKYTVIATNRIEPAEDIIRWYNQRGEHSENRIKDLKIGFGMERMPCGQFEVNAVFFKIGILAYNLFRLTVRWRLYQIAGKIVYHQNQIFLKLNRRFCNLFMKFA